jgi:hypothetical protein
MVAVLAILPTQATAAEEVLMSPASPTREPAAEQPSAGTILEVRLIAGVWSGGPVEDGGLWRSEAAGDDQAAADGLLAALPLRQARTFGSGLVPPAAGGRGSGPAWFSDGVLVFVEGEAGGRWAVRFEDLATGTTAAAEVAVARPAVVAYPCREGGRAVAVVVSPQPREPRPAPWAASLHTDRFTARSRDGRSWQDPGGLLRWRLTEVVLPREGEGPWLLRADEVAYSAAAGELAARGAELLDGAGARLAEGEMVIGFGDGTVEVRERSRP